MTANIQWNPYTVMIQYGLTPNVPMMLKVVPYSLVHAKSVSPISFGRIISGRLPDQNECIN